MTASKFLRIICPRCKQLQIVYGKSSIKVKCKNCSYLLVKTKGGKAKVRARVQEVIK